MTNGHPVFRPSSLLPLIAASPILHVWLRKKVENVRPSVLLHPFIVEGSSNNPQKSSLAFRVTGP